MRRLIVSFGLVLFFGQLFAQDNLGQFSNAELFITRPNRNYIESFEIYKPGKQFQNPYRRLDFIFMKYKDLDNDSIIYGIRLVCLTDYLSKDTKTYNSILDMDEIDSLIKWIKFSKEKASELVEYQTISHVTKKGLLMFGIFNEKGKLYFRLTNNKYDFGTAIFFDLSVLDNFLAFLEEVKTKQISK
ncbi:MAG: hypothetical protein HXX16_07255 [Bacteroidales bacterium]|nr:hypothetical protein [Bacteroidales bacterium]